MFLIDFSMDVFFRILNALIFFGVVVYFARRSFIPKAKLDIQQEKKNLQTLEIEKQNIKNQLHNVAIALEQQELLSKQLLDKIVTWHQTVSQEEFEQHKQALEIKNKIEHKATVQAERQALMNVNKQIAHDIVNNMQKKLIDYFEDTPQGHQYNNHIITSLQESNS